MDLRLRGDEGSKKRRRGWLLGALVLGLMACGLANANASRNANASANANGNGNANTNTETPRPGPTDTGTSSNANANSNSNSNSHADDNIRELRVCADPNNLPFSNAAGEGFENKLVALLAKDLGARVRYTWWAQRRGAIRNTLNAGTCEVIPGMASSADMTGTTDPYYRSTYVFVTRADRSLQSLRGFDDPRLRRLRIGVQLIGDDGANTPPAHALARRGIVDNVRGYTVYGDYAQPAPQKPIIDAVANGDIDVALVWGPTAGYFAAQAPVPLVLTPVTPWLDGPQAPMVFDVSMGVRRDDRALRRELDRALARNRAAIANILADYHVPIAP